MDDWQENPMVLIKNKETIENRVQFILENYPQTKGDDVLLIYRYLRYYTDVRLSFQTFKQLFTIPAFESITRARRHVQRQYPALLPTKRVRHKREVLQELNRAYYSDKQMRLKL